MYVCLCIHTHTHKHTLTHKHTYVQTLTLSHIHTQGLRPIDMHHIGLLYSWLEAHAHAHKHARCAHIQRERQSHGAHVHVHGTCAWGMCMCMLTDSSIYMYKNYVGAMYSHNKKKIIFFALYMVFFGGFFLGSVKRSSMLIRYPGRQKGWRVGLRNGCMGGLQKLITVFSGWAGLQKLRTDLDRFYPYKAGV
jgi:hypothetical protein